MLAAALIFTTAIIMLFTLLFSASLATTVFMSVQSDICIRLLIRRLDLQDLSIFSVSHSSALLIREEALSKMTFGFGLCLLALTACFEFILDASISMIFAVIFCACRPIAVYFILLVLRTSITIFYFEFAFTVSEAQARYSTITYLFRVSFSTISMRVRSYSHS